MQAGLRVVECPYCETPLLATSEGGIRRWSVRPEIDGDEAKRAARRWLSTGWSRDRALRREARPGGIMLCFLPFFRVEADCVGIALGTELRERTVGSGKNRRTETYEVDVERRSSGSFDRTYPALNVAEWGVQKIDLHGDRLDVFDPAELGRHGMVFPPTVSEAEVMQSALSQFKMESDPSLDLERLRFKFLETLRERISVIYYPLWIVRYTFRDRTYQILIDGEDGNLVYGKAPGNDLYRAVMMVLGIAGPLYLATTAVQLIGFDLGSMAIAGTLAFAALAWGWRKFRHGGVVEEGTGIE